MQLTRKIIRLPIHTDKASAVQDVLTNRSPSLWRGNDCSFQIGLHRNRTLLDIANIDQVTVTVKADDDRTGPALMTKTVAYADLNRTLTAEQWAAGTAAHAEVAFTKEETRLALNGEQSRTFWLVVHGLTTDTPSRELTFGAGAFVITEDGVGGDDDAPYIGASLIPSGAVYDTDGNYIFTGATVNWVYDWTAGENDTDISDGATTYATSPARFTAENDSFVLTGTPDELVTAQLRRPSYYTAEEADARFMLAYSLVELWEAVEDAEASAAAAAAAAALAFGKWFTAASEAAMLSLAADRGDRCVRTDLAPVRIFQLKDWPAETLANWEREPSVFNWIDAAWNAGTTYAAGDALSFGVNTIISQQAGNIGNDPADTANIGVGQPWGYLAKGSSLQLGTATPTTIAPHAGASGVSAKAAREDHQHPAAVASWTVPGLMAAADKKRFDTSEIGGASALVNAAAVSTDGNWIYLAGNFTTWDNTTQGRIARVDRRGRIDPFWAAGAGFNVAPNWLVPLPDGRILCGNQTVKMSYQGGAAKWVHMLTATGAVDGTWVSPASIASTGGDILLAIAYLSDGAGRVALLSWNTLRVTDMQGVTEFVEEFSANAHFITSYGCKLLVSSRPTASYGAVLNPRAVKLVDFCEDAYGAYTGAVNTAFAAGAGTGWSAAANESKFAPDGSFAIVGGALSYAGIDWSWNGGAEVSRGLLKVHTAGADIGEEVAGWSVTLGMETAADWPRPLGVDSQGRVYFTGNILSVNGTEVTPWRLYRVDSNGGNLTQFAGFNGVVYSMAIIDDDKLLVAGAFTQYGSLPVGHAVMINSAGARIHHLLAPDTPIRVGVYRERFVDAAAMAPSVTGGAVAVLAETATNKVTRDFYAFPHDAEAAVEFDTKLPAEWNGGALRVRLDLFPQSPATASNGMVFEVQAVATGNGETDDPAFAAGAVVIDTVVAVPGHHITPAVVLNVSGSPQPGDLLHFRIIRRVDHASDNAGGDVRLKGLGIQYLESTTEPTEWS